MTLKASRPALAAIVQLVAALLLLHAVKLVSSESTNAGNSVANPASIATAGTGSTFTITAKDESAASRTSGGDNFIVELEGTRSIAGSVVDNLDGSYKISYTATKSGMYEVSAKLAKSGGLSAAYYENVWFFYTPVKRTVDPVIDMDWGTGLITATGADYISIRWTGKLKPLYSETHTFYSTTDDGARLWVDNMPLIDRWDSYTNDTSATISLKANVFYNIKMEYKEVTGTAYAKLRWSSSSTPKEIIPASALYYETHIYQSPFTVSVVPSSACASQSTAVGDGLVIATAGTAAQLTVQSNDEYDNELGVGGDIFAVRVGPSNEGTRPAHAIVVDETDSSYSIEYTPYISQYVNVLQADLLTQNQVLATYYDNTDFTTPKVSTAQGASKLFKATYAGGAYQENSVTFSAEAKYSVKFRGFFKPPNDGTYKFQVVLNTGDNKSGAKLLVDNKKVVEIAVTDTDANKDGEIYLRTLNYYEIYLEWQANDSASSARSVEVKVNDGAGGSTFSALTASTMYSGQPIQGAPFDVTVKPARTSAAKSVATDSTLKSLCTATAGRQADFTITARDLYDNLRAIGGETFKVRLTGVDSTAGAITDLNNGEYRVTYTVSQSGTYDISVVYGASGINGSPFRIYAQPTNRHLPNTIATGQALTLATAGISTSVTITVKDRHDNQQPAPGIFEHAGMKFALNDDTAISTTLPTCNDCKTQPISHNDCVDDCPGYKSSPGSKLVAVPTTGDRATMKMTYQVTKSGIFQLSVKGSTDFEGQVRDSPFPLTIFPHLPCASTSTATGTSLTLVTAGLDATFTVQSRDEFSNLRGSHVGDNFVAFVRQPVAKRDHPATVVDVGDSTYILAFGATKSSTNQLWAQLANAGTVIQDIYADTEGTGNSPTNSLVTAVSAVQANNKAVRYRGLFRPSNSGTYTFTAAVAANTQGILYVDNLKKDLTSSDKALTVTGLVANRFYDFNLVVGGTGTTTMKLTFTAANSVSGNFDDLTGRLYTGHHIAGSPFSSLIVRPSLACATTSHKDQMAISLTTAGTAASFTIQTVDQFVNNRDIGGDPWNFALLQGATVPTVADSAQDDSKDGGVLRFQGTATYTELGRYHIQYTSTMEGHFQLRGKIQQSGGLYGEYFENDDLTDHGKFDSNAVLDPFNRVDSKIDFDWGDGQPVDEASAEFSAWNGKKSIGPDYFSARWTGMIKPEHTEVYTFSAEVDDGIRVWVDDLLIMDYWYVHSKEVDGTIALMGSQLYNIKVEYRDITGNAIIRFRWRSKSQQKQVVPSGSLYHATTSSKLSWPESSAMQIPTVTEPTVVCSTLSHAQGPGLTIATAGTMSYFTIQSRDEYNNLRKLGDAPDFHVRLLPVPSGNQRPYHAGLKGDGMEHSAMYRIPSEHFKGGLTATFYDSATPQGVTCQAQPWHNTNVCPGLDLQVTEWFYGTGSSEKMPVNAANKNARFRGYFRPTTSGAYTFSFSRTTNAVADTELELKVDDQVKVATSVAGNPATAVSLVGNQFYQLDILYKAKSGNAGGFKLRYQAPGIGTAKTIPTDRLFPLAGRYKVEYTPIVKTDYSMLVDVAYRGGLDATFYDDMELLQAVGAVTHSNIDFSGSVFQDTVLPRDTHDQGYGSQIGLSDLSSFSVRWEGFLAHAQTGDTSFRVKVKETDERVKLWVDNSLLIDRWELYNAASAQYDAVIPLPATAGRQVGGSDVKLGTNNMYFDIKLEYKQFGANSGIELLMKTGGGAYTNFAKVQSGNLYRRSPIMGSPFPPLAAMPAPSCATRSTVRGTGLTEATAGMPNYFTIQSHDEFDNERGIGGDYYFTRLVRASHHNSGNCEGCPEYVWGTVVDEGDSSYSASYLPTKKGVYRVKTSLATQGGLTTTYYSSSTDSSSGQTTGHKIANPIAASPAASRRARFEGFVQPATAGLYTFKVIDGSSSVNSAIYINNFNNSLSASASGNDILSTYSFTTANSLYLLKIEFDHNAQETNGFSLQWKTGNDNLANIATGRLYYLKDVDPTRETNVKVFVEDTDPNTCHTSGNGLTRATAGEAASFTITTKDSYANLRMLDEDTFLVQVDGPGIVHTRRAVHMSTDAAKHGTYHVDYMTTISGNYDVRILRGTAGGLKAEYFNNMWLIGEPAFVGIDAEIDYDWKDQSIRPSTAPSSVILGSDYMSARWSGYIMPELNEEYTFHTDTDEGVRLWINDRMVIDQWEAQNTDFSATFGGFVVGALYSVKMEFRESTENAHAKLLFSSDSIAKQPVPSDVLFHNAQHIYGSPFKMYAYPAITCAASSTVDGPGLSFGTTGNRASFTIQAKDQYHNVKTQWVADSTEVFVVRTMHGANGDYSKLGTVTHNAVKGKWNAVYQPTRCGASNIYVSMLDMQAGGKGVLATYYDTTDYSGTAVTVSGHTNYAIASALSPISGTHGSAKYASMFRIAAANSAGVQTFKFVSSANAADVTAKVYVNNKLVLDVDTTANTLSATTFLASTTEFYDVVVEYSGKKSGAQFELQWVKGTGTPATIADTKLRRPLDVSNSPYQYVTQPDVTAWTTSTISGEALTIATAGVSGQFTIQSKDLNNNNRDLGGDEYLMHAASATGAAFSGTVTDNGDGTYIVKYTPSRQGAYTVKVYLGTSDMTTSLHVQPGKTSSSQTLANSNQLTIATAGHMATFTIQAKDEYKNLRTIESNDWIVRLQGPGDEEHNNFMRYIGGHPFNPNIDQLGKFETHFRTSQSGKFSLSVQLADNNGLKAVYYRDDTLTNAVLERVDSTVSFNWGADSPNAAVGIVDGFSAAWSGYVKPDATKLYTFHVGHAPSTTDRDNVKLWVDDHYIIHEWDETISNSAQSGTIMLAANTLYDIKLYYKDVTGDAAAELRWQPSGGTSQVIPSTRLFSRATHIAGSPFSATVFPTLTSGSLSTVSGAGLTLATAGITASFTVTAKDSLGNIKTTNDDVFVVRARKQGDKAVRDISGTVTPMGDGRYAAVYTPTYKRWESFSNDGPWHDVMASLAKIGGLQATVYAGTNGKAQFLATAFAKASQKSAAGNTESHKIRYQGFVQPEYAEQFTFSFAKTAGTKISVKIDGKEILDPTAAGATVAAGVATAIQFMNANHYYDIEVEYDNNGVTNGAMGDFKWKSNSRHSGGNPVLIPSGRLFQAYDVTFKTFEEGGLLATFYGVSTFASPSFKRQTATVDWSGASTTDRPYPESLGAVGAFSVRWHGFFRPSRRDRYTFSVITGADQTAKLWVDPVNNKFADSDKLFEINEAGTAGSGTVQFPLENDLYDIRLDYAVKASATNRLIQLVYENNGQTYTMYNESAPPSEAVSKTVIPGDRLYRIRATPTIIRDDSSFDPDQWNFDANACLGQSNAPTTRPDGVRRYRECRRHGVRVNDVLHVDVKPAVACAATSTIDVAKDDGNQKQVSLATAGIPRSFEVIVRDEYENLRDSFDQGIVSRQYLKANSESAEPFRGTVKAKPTSATLNDYDRASVYQVDYMSTRSGDFWNEVALADSFGNGLFGTYFMRSTLSGGAVTRVDAVIDFDWGRGAPTSDGIIPADGFSARWTGYVRPQFSELYTFFVHADEGSKLTIDGQTVIDNWSATTGQEVSGTFTMNENMLHDIALEYMDSSNNAFVKLQYQSVSAPKAVIPSARLYPSKHTFKEGRRSLFVHPAVHSATASNLVGDGLSIATAGVQATFMINSRDQYSNMRTKHASADCDDGSISGCIFIGRLVPDSATLANRPHHMKAGASAALNTIVGQKNEGRSTYTGAYTYTRSGSYNVHVASHASSANGLMATFYDDAAFAIPRVAYTDNKLPAHTLANAVTPACLTDDSTFSARWSGFFQHGSHTGQRTFIVNTGEPVKVWFDDALIIDQWATSSVADKPGTANLHGDATTFYNIRVDFKGTSDDTGSQLQLKYEGSNAVNGNFYSSFLITGEPKRMRMNPNVACAGTGTHTGHGLSIATAGIQALYTVTCRDQYYNERGIGGDVFVSRAFPANCRNGASCAVHDFDASATAKAGSSCTGCPAVVRGSVIDNQDNTYSAAFTPTKKGYYKVVNSLALQGGLTATYYKQTKAEVFSDASVAAGIATAVNDGVPVDFSAGDNKVPVANAAGSIRWHGFVKPSKASEYTFYIKSKRAGSGERVKLWVDNSVVIDKSTATSAAVESGTIGFGAAETLYDIQVAYHSDTATGAASANAGITLEWESSGSVVASNNQYQSRIPTQRMFGRHDVMPAYHYANDKELVVHSTVGCATKSVASGDALTLATAGGARTFTISAKDQYENTRSLNNDMAWMVTLHGSGGTPTYQASVVAAVTGTGHAQASLYKVSYTANAAKSYEMFAKYNNDNSHGSPFALTVRPTTVCGSKTTVTGSGLTSAIVNADAHFTVQARDEFANAKTATALPSGTAYLLTANDHAQSTQWLQVRAATNFAKSETVVHTTAANGKYTGTYKLTAAGTGKAFTHVTFAVKGGLLATYYATNAAKSTLDSPDLDSTKTPDGTTPVVAKVTHVDKMDAAKVSGYSNPSGKFMQARFAGFLNNGATSVVTITPGGAVHTLAYVEGTKVVDTWSSVNTNAQTHATKNGYQAFLMEQSANAANTDIKANVFTGVDSTKMYAAFEVSGSPFDLTISQ